MNIDTTNARQVALWRLTQLHQDLTIAEQLYNELKIGLDDDRLLMILQTVADICQVDAVLAQEVACYGNSLIRKLVCSENGNEEITELACIVASTFSGTSTLPMTMERIRSRLPALYKVKSNKNSDDMSDDNSNTLLIGQVTTRQSAQHDVGFVLWPAAVSLARYITDNSVTIQQQQDDNARFYILELGAGCGLTGLVAACTFDNATIYLTDYNDLCLQNLQNNITLNQDCCFRTNTTVTVCGLDFTQQESCENSGWIDTSGTVHESVDLILAADVICQESDAVAVAQTIRRALKPTTGRALLASATSHHRYGVNMLKSACEECGLSVKVQGLENNGNEMEGTTGYVAGMKIQLYEVMLLL